MGGTVIETESEKLIRKGQEASKAEGRAEEIVTIGLEFALDNAAIMKRLQDKVGLSLERANDYLEQYILMTENYLKIQLLRNT